MVLAKLSGFQMVIIYQASLIEFMELLWKCLMLPKIVLCDLILPAIHIFYMLTRLWYQDTNRGGRLKLSVLFHCHHFLLNRCCLFASLMTSHMTENTIRTYNDWHNSTAHKFKNINQNKNKK